MNDDVFLMLIISNHVQLFSLHKFWKSHTSTHTENVHKEIWPSFSPAQQVFTYNCYYLFNCYEWWRLLMLIKSCSVAFGSFFSELNHPASNTVVTGARGSIVHNFHRSSICFESHTSTQTENVHKEIWPSLSPAQQVFTYNCYYLFSCYESTTIKAMMVWVPHSIATTISGSLCSKWDRRIKLWNLIGRAAKGPDSKTKWSKPSKKWPELDRKRVMKCIHRLR